MVILGPHYYLGLHGQPGQFLRVKRSRIRSDCSDYRRRGDFEKKTVCVLALSATESLIRGAFPLAQLFPGATQLQTYQDLQAGKCDVLASQYTEWGFQRKNEEVDIDCQLSWNGIVQFESSGGMASTIDSFCSGVIGQVVDLHMSEMVNSGRVAQIWEKYTNAKYGVSCPTHRSLLARTSWALDTGSQDGNASGSKATSALR